MIERKIYIGPQLSGKIGRIYDLSRYSNNRHSLPPAVGIIVVDSDGIGHYCVRKESRYMIMIPGLLNPIIDEVGSAENWSRTIQYRVPTKPIIKEVVATHDYKEDISFSLIKFRWETKSRSRIIWEVELKRPGQDWEMANSEVSVPEYELKITEAGTHQIRIRGRNKNGQHGKYSDIYEYNVTNIREEGTIKLLYTELTGLVSGTMYSLGGWANKSVIKTIKITTTSSKWQLEIYESTSGSPISTIIGNKNAEYNLDKPYRDLDETLKLHVKFTDLVGSDTADIVARGHDLS